MTTNFDNSSQISTNTTVIGGREDGEALVLMSPSEAFHCHLMGTANELKIVGLAKFLCCDRAEQVTATTFVGPEVGDGVSRIGPQQTINDGRFFVVEHDLVVRAGDVADTFNTDKSELG